MQRIQEDTVQLCHSGTIDSFPPEEAQQAIQKEVQQKKASAHLHQKMCGKGYSCVWQGRIRCQLRIIKRDNFRGVRD